MPNAFEAFISYRRSDGAAFARRLRRALQDFRAPKSLRNSLTPLRVYLDTIYERATNDFYERVIRPALLESRYLIVVATPEAVDRGPDKVDWIRREIHDFEAGPNAGNLIVVLAKDPVAVPLPGELNRRYPNLQLIDLRGLSALSFLNPLKAARLSEGMVKLAAPLLGLAPEHMPSLLREEERRQQFRLGLAAGATTATVAAVAGLSVWALQSRNSAVDALTSSLFATDRVIQSVASSLAEGETRTNLLTTSCDLLDSLQDRAPREPRTNAIVVCAVERSASRDRQNEPAEASRILAGALAVAEKQYSRTKSPDDALAVLEARRATLARILASSQTAGGAHALNEFVERARSLSSELPSEQILPNAAAGALQTLAVLLAQRNSLRDAVVATDAAIELRQLAITRGADLGVVLDNVRTILLNAELHRRRMEEVQATQAVERARALFGKIDPAGAVAQGWQDRYREVQEMIGATGKGAQR